MALNIDNADDEEDLPVLPKMAPVRGAKIGATHKTHEELRRILNLAFEQSATGKGQERHGNNKPFEEQPILTIPAMPGIGLGGLLYQIVKKTNEAGGMVAREDNPAAKRELLGVIVYAAAAYLFVEHIPGNGED